MPFEIEIQLVCKVRLEFELCELAGQINFESVDVSPEIFLVFSVAKLESRPVGKLICPQLPVERDVHVRPMFPAPVTVVVFAKTQLVIESEVDPIPKTMVHESQIRIMKIEVSRIVPEFQMFPNRYRPVFVNIITGNHRLPELNVSVGKSKALFTIKKNGDDSYD